MMSCEKPREAWDGCHAQPFRARHTRRQALLKEIVLPCGDEGGHFNRGTLEEDEGAD